jgi:hypothetical protein
MPMETHDPGVLNRFLKPITRAAQRFARKVANHRSRTIASQIPVIAISGEYDGSPEGLIADAFFSKAQYSPNQLFAKILELIGQAPIRPHIARPDKAPVWVPRNESGYFVLTCTECLRSFSVPEEEAHSELRKTQCAFCNTEIRYLADRVVGKRHKGRAG